MFIAGKKGLQQDGSERLLMTGYGGFNVSETPAWNPVWAWWLQQGGWFAVPNLRGGGEYGEEWHEQGMFEKKQNVFDDWFAAADYLIDQQVHLAAALRHHGRFQRRPAHGRIHHPAPRALLRGAVRLPTARHAALPEVRAGPALDHRVRLRRQRRSNSPISSNIRPIRTSKPGSNYPAVMFFTGDSDTRVDPLHARKMTALLQVDVNSGRPILLHYSVAGGHSAGVSVEQQIQDHTDQLTFLWTETASPRAAK